MKKIDVLRSTSFGKSIAEDEQNDLGSYFVKTEYWRKIYTGDVDIVYGQKGSGKSAIYFALMNSIKDFEKENIILIPAEKPKGAPVFRKLAESPLASEEQFQFLWKLYFLSLIGNEIKERNLVTTKSKKLITFLEDEKLLERSHDLKSLLKDVYIYTISFFKKRVQGVEGGVNLSETTGGITGFTGKIIFEEPTQEEFREGNLSIDNLLEQANEVLSELDYKFWILLDRLDVAFLNPTEEKNAIRALFRVYIDFLGFNNVKIKIFIRPDIWKDITEDGFREASHITKFVSIQWDDSNLFNLIIRRALNNSSICTHYGINPEEIIKDNTKQSQVFYNMFPEKVESNVLNTYRWILSRTRDGNGYNAPRDIIQLLNETKDCQIKEMELGTKEPDGNVIFSRSALRNAVKQVSNIKLFKTIYAEYPDLKDYIEKLRKQKATQKITTLMKIWNLNEIDAQKLVDRLCSVGVFEAIGDIENKQYRVPFLYREELGLIQGSAE